MRKLTAGEDRDAEGGGIGTGFGVWERILVGEAEGGGEIGACAGYIN